MEWLQGFSLFLLIILGLYFITWWAKHYDEKDRKAWKMIDEGQYDRAEYGHYTYDRRSGAMVHHTTTYKMDCTAIYFKDGRTRVCNGRISMPEASGTYIRV